MKEINDKFVAVGQKGVVIVVVLVIMMLLTLMGIGMMTISSGVRHQANVIKHETDAVLAAEAGYEQAVFWMSQQQDMVYVFQNGGAHNGTLDFGEASCNYQISFDSFVGSRPVFRIKSIGTSGDFSREVDVAMFQSIDGWATASMRIPVGSASGSVVDAYFGTGETVDLPLHVNKIKDSPDNKDIFILGTPQFTQEASVGESRYTASGADKYNGVMNLFQQGINFNQPDVRVVNAATVATKVQRFKDITKALYKFTPVVPNPAPFATALPAVQIEFYVEGGVGKVRITNNCIVKGYNRGNDNLTYDYRIVPNTNPQRYERYNIYAYHVRPIAEVPIVVPVTNTYVTEKIGDIQSAPGGQIYVDGNVVIGGDSTLHSGNQCLKGKMTIVATGNIWLADNLFVDGDRDAVTGKPALTNPNICGLISQGVVKVVDPGMTDPAFTNAYVAPDPTKYTYVPIGIIDPPPNVDPKKRRFTDPTVIEASVTSALGGFGPENLKRGTCGMKEATPPLDTLILRGSITDAVIAVTYTGDDGYYSNFQMDQRVLQGMLPGDMWLTSKYLATPGGWSQFRAEVEK